MEGGCVHGWGRVCQLTKSMELGEGLSTQRDMSTQLQYVQYLSVSDTGSSRSEVSLSGTTFGFQGL